MGVRSQTEVVDPLQQEFAAAVPLLAVLFPGDVLFIPALWHHNVQTCSMDEASAFLPSAQAASPCDDPDQCHYPEARLMGVSLTDHSSGMRTDRSDAVRRSEVRCGGEDLSAETPENCHSGAGQFGWCSRAADLDGAGDGGGAAEDGFSISVNVFWRHLDASFYPRKDVYGNKDLVQATAAEAAADKVIQALQQLPPHSEYRAFYTQRVLCKIMREVNQTQT
ncbi:hypothetical protein DUNSADRAFT_14606 [Dunaliella salina]|uniref:Cupin-like domain-containing protein n=1 Tax=Dunaliella salina TaxID=3046 RepID=A0ABQ7H2L6_DUNSA|nr:hypothetical protein DUNSADRAFT_14606 [Dunaliella salina]|eukprot:KAF5841048.1 hypothetical protein DUNSADRAFT_14606 [Dunaliella salina]